MIILSAGHDPLAKGATYNEFNEHDEAVKWVQIIHNAILGYHLYPCEIAPHSRTSPEQSAGKVLADKIAWVNKQPSAVLALEVHFNSDTSKRAKGSETLYAPGSEAGKWAAELVQEELTGLFPPSRGIKEGWYRQDHPGHVDYAGDVEGDEKPLAFLTWTKPVALIIEPEFIYNQEAIELRRAPACVALAAALVHIAGVLTK